MADPISIRIASFNNGAAEAFVDINPTSHEIQTLSAIIQSGTLMISLRKGNGDPVQVSWGVGQWIMNDLPNGMIAVFDEEVQEYGLPPICSYTAQWIEDD